ncbi:hypothetical protein GQ457_08G014740 [Hibiscus cannabinus]
MKEFRDCLDTLDVVDHPFSGSIFTWCNFQEDAPLSWNLDRVLINQAWFDRFPASSVEFLDPNCSDHCPSFVTLKIPLGRPPKTFKLFGFWVDHPEFMQVVTESWALPAVGNPLKMLFAKLKMLKVALREFNREHFGDVSKRVLLKRVELSNLQSNC